MKWFEKQRNSGRTPLGVHARDIESTQPTCDRSGETLNSKATRYVTAKWIGVCFALLAFSAAPLAHADGLRRSTGSPAELGAMQPGNQLMLTGQSGSIDFAGRTISLTDFSGLLGYASEVAYIVAIAGNATEGKEKAKEGQMLLLPTLGGKTSVARYDASRLIDSWTATEKTEFADTFGQLQAIARRQSGGIFMGRLGRTDFNVAVSGSASEELARRSIVGGGALQSIRFSEHANQLSLEKAIVSRFTGALLSGDIATVAQLMDPLPFGLSDMRGEPDDARTLAATQLVYERNWAAVIRPGEPVFDDKAGLWTIAGPSPVLITLRSAQDISFIKSIRIGG